MTKAKPISIEVNRGEGPSREWAFTAPSGGGHDKCDFVITFDNGDTYSGRYDLTREDASRSNLLVTHMTEIVSFMSGARCPPHLPEERYRNFLDSRPELQKQYRLLADTCHIGD